MNKLRINLHSAIGSVLLVFWVSLLAFTGAEARAEEERIYKWEKVYYGKFNNKPSLLHSASAFFGKIALGDLDGDGDPDLLLGKEDGSISRFENEGSVGRPNWRMTDEQIKAVFPTHVDGIIHRRLRTIQVKSRSAPALVDIDGDGDQDLFVGTSDSRLYFYRNIGNNALAAFELITDRFVPLEFGKFLVPFFIDVTGDRAPELFIGNENGEVWLIHNQGSPKRARFCGSRDPKLSCRPKPRKLTAISPESHAAPGLVDWDRDGDVDLFVGKRDGTIAFFKNTGSVTDGTWKLIQPRFLAIDSGGYAAPNFLDANSDNVTDLITGNGANNLYLYTSKGTNRTNDMWKVTDNLLKMSRMGGGETRLIMTSGDLDADGDLDLVLGDRSGSLRWVENTGTKTQPAWQPQPQTLLKASARPFTAPTLGDLEGDGDLDLLVGSLDGRLWLVVNVGTPQVPKWKLEDNNFAGVDVGSSSVPFLVDMDRDGDLDLLVGNARGVVVYFRNDGTKTRPQFAMLTTNFGKIKVGQTAVPALFDWNEDKKLDLVVGNREGQLSLSENRNVEKSIMLPRWKLKTRFWELLQVKGFSSPHFADLNGDGKADLLVADGEGNLQFWLNRGFEIVQGKAAVAKAREKASQAKAGDPTEGSSSGFGLGAATTLNAKKDGSTNVSDLLDIEMVRGPLPPVYTLASRKYGGLKFRGKAVPAFFDVDDDGDLDIVVGTGKGLLVHIENQGSPRKPEWKRKTEKFAGYDKGRNPSPLFADFDGDGKKDLLIGTESGKLFLYINSIKGRDVSFIPKPDALKNVRVGRNASPSLASRPDGMPLQMMVGDLSGNILAFDLLGEPKALSFKRTHRRFLGLDVGISATAFVGDIDRDKNPDLLLGSDAGKILNYTKVPKGKKNEWGWKVGPDYLKTLSFPLGATPRLADIDGDGDQDLMVGSEAGTIYFFRNDADQTGEGR